MKRFSLALSCLPAVLLVSSVFMAAQILPSAPSTPPTSFSWSVVVNNGDTVPGETRVFNSYNQPSINLSNLVVFRGRSKGGNGGEPAHGVFTRDMRYSTSTIQTLFDRKTLVPQPNNQNSMFIEPPSFPRIDMSSSTIATRANHQPVWEYPIGVDVDGSILTTKAGTTGIYATPYGSLLSGANNLGGVPEFSHFAVPSVPALKFDVFPGAPALANKNTIVFKGNFTEGTVGKTGVYYRILEDKLFGGYSKVFRIADSDRIIPKSLPTTKFGSTAPPSAAMIGKTPAAVFAGFDNEDAPTMGGLYLAKLTGEDPELKTLVSIGTQVPGEAKGVGFTRIGEGVSFDGRFVAFWAAWGKDIKTLTLFCPSDGSKPRLAFCKSLYGDPATGTPGTRGLGFKAEVLVHQGIFVYDINTSQLRVVAKSPNDFDDFVYWNFSGLVPAEFGGPGGETGGSGDEETGPDETGEPARWRSASFAAASGLVDGNLNDANFHVAFKARKAAVVDGSYVNPIDGIYLRKGPDASPVLPLVYTGMIGTAIDPDSEVEVEDEVTGETSLLKLPVTEMGLERDGFRGMSLAINVSMGTEEAGWAGIYLTAIPNY